MCSSRTALDAAAALAGAAAGAARVAAASRVAPLLNQSKRSGRLGQDLLPASLRRRTAEGGFRLLPVVLAQNTGGFVSDPGPARGLSLALPMVRLTERQAHPLRELVEGLSLALLRLARSAGLVSEVVSTTR